MSSEGNTIFVFSKRGAPSPAEERLKRSLGSLTGLHPEELWTATAFSLAKKIAPDALQPIAEELLIDPLLQEARVNEMPKRDADWLVEVEYKRGVTDNAASVSKLAFEDFFGAPFSKEESVKTLRLTFLKGSISRSEVERAACQLLGNPLIETLRIRDLSPSCEIEEISLERSDEELLTLSRERLLALSLEEMKAVQAHYRKAETLALRKKWGLGAAPTDVELEALAQTWSEHCKHKIFRAQISYLEGSERSLVKGLFATYIEGASRLLEKKRPWLVSLFEDNAGIIRFDSEFNLAFKVETHNSPSALDPYGGALTGILGVNRDILGAGVGARLLANSDIFCLPPPCYEGELPAPLHHPKRIFEGVRLGVEHGGNKSGVPTVNGALFFDPRYLGKPLVYCGSLGIMPSEIRGEKSHRKEIADGDLIVLAGGRTGRDGIHGATFSSEELHEESPLSAVQIGDPFTQKKVHDFLLEVRDRALFRCLTDNGAGGLSSSVGELAKLSGGCAIHLEKVPLKGERLAPWEIFLSESQERMTLAVDPGSFEELKELAALHEVEIAAIGSFNRSGLLHALFEGRTAALLPLDFLHEGLPPLKLEAVWRQKKRRAQKTLKESLSCSLHRILASYNVCSREALVRQYDHEVQGGAVLKPYVGAASEGPSDAAVIWPLEAMEKGSKEAVALSNGLCPRLGDGDCYLMAACALDEAVRNLISVGTDPETIALLDNFCWPDPLYDPIKNPDGKEKLAELVRACRALYEGCLAYEMPIISGKDSMKNDYRIGSLKLSIPPTLLVSAVGKVPDLEKLVSMDFKEEGDPLYLVGKSCGALGCSEYLAEEGREGGDLPEIGFKLAKALYQKSFLAMQKGLVRSCHDLSEGGLAVALCESAFGGDLGAEIDLDFVPVKRPLGSCRLLFSESPSRLLFSLVRGSESAFESLFKGLPCKKIGRVKKERELLVKRGGKTLLCEELGPLKKSWQRTLQPGAFS